MPTNPNAIMFWLKLHRITGGPKSASKIFDTAVEFVFHSPIMPERPQTRDNLLQIRDHLTKSALGQGCRHPPPAPVPKTDVLRHSQIRGSPQRARRGKKSAGIMGQGTVGDAQSFIDDAVACICHRTAHTSSTRSSVPPTGIALMKATAISTASTAKGTI
jgi:hypothetical protein